MIKKFCLILASFFLLLSLASGNRALAKADSSLPTGSTSALIAGTSALIGSASSFSFVYSAPNKQFVTDLVKQIAEILPTQTLSSINVTELSSLKPEITLVTTGRSALAEVLASPYYRQHRIVCTLISSADYYAEINKYSSTELQTTALFSDPSPTHQIFLASLLMDKPQIAFIYDTQTQFLIDIIRHAAKANALPEPTFIENNAANINVILQNRQLADADILLASPLKTIYNSENTKNIIFTLLSRNQALIGYSSGWVSSGALATVYSDKDDITHSLADLLDSIAKSLTVTSSQALTMPALPAPQYPNHINVKLNQNIAKLLAIEPIAESALADSLRERIAKNAH